MKDTGIGIEEGRLKYLFKVFGELKNKQTMKKVKDQNIGLGLTCVSELAQTLGGSVCLV